jgi:hypothetical protein
MVAFEFRRSALLVAHDLIITLRKARRVFCGTGNSEQRSIEVQDAQPENAQ